MVNIYIYYRSCKPINYINCVTFVLVTFRYCFYWNTLYENGTKEIDLVSKGGVKNAENAHTGRYIGNTPWPG